MLYYLKLHKNWHTVLTSTSPHVILTLTSPNYQPSTLDTFCTMLISHTTFPSFPHPIFWQWHWSPHNVDIYNSQIHGSWFREYGISYHFVMSQSLIFVHAFSIYLYQCILFYSIQLIITQFSIYVRFLSVYDHVLWRLVVALETVIDMMIDICICLTLTDHMCTLHIWLNEHLFYHDYSCIHVKLWIIFVNLYDHAPHVSYYIYYFHFVW